MAGRFNINLARERDGSPSVMKLAGHTPRFFAVGGVAEAGQTPRFGLLVRESDGVVLATGFLLRTPSDDDRTWSMAFREEQSLTAGGPFTLRIQSEFNDQSPDQVAGLRFAEEVVSVLYPAGGTICAGAITAYGSFSGTDTRVDRVDVTDVGAGTVTMSDRSPYYNSQGFWASTLSGLTAGKSYSVQAFGDVNNSPPGGTFAVIAC